MNEEPRQREQYDWRKGMCQFCGIKAVNGCCAVHQMHCPICDGFGATTKENWNKYHGKGTNDFFLQHALLLMQKHDTGFEVRMGSEGGHYDHGDEPNIRIFKDGVEVYHNWGIFLPTLVKEAAEWIEKNKV